MDLSDGGGEESLGINQRLRRQQVGGMVKTWAGIFGDHVIGLIRVPAGVKVTSGGSY